MSRFKQVLISLIVAVTFTFVICAVRPRPVYASTDTTTILIVLGSVIGGLALIAIIVTIFVRNNPAWMPLGPEPDPHRLERRFGRPPDSGAVKFGLDCGVRSEGVPLFCWR